MKKRDIITLIIVFGVLIFALTVGLIDEHKKKQKEWYEEYNQSQIVIATKNYLKEKVTYPESFEFTAYPSIRYGTKDDKRVYLSGKFKCCNAFGVYSTYTYYIEIELGEKWLVRDYIIE